MRSAGQPGPRREPDGAPGGRRIDRGPLLLPRHDLVGGQLGPHVAGGVHRVPPVLAADHPGGVAWDNEAPPVYGDVPPSPPSYPVVEEPPQYPVEDYCELEVTEAIGLSPGSRRASAS